MIFSRSHTRFTRRSPSGSEGVEPPKHQAKIAGTFLIGLLAALTIAIPDTSAQEVTGTIVGNVVDATGAAMHRATVTAKDVNRGTTWTTKTDESGTFRIERVPVGRYEVKVEAQGFKTAVNPAFDLVLNQVARLNIAMSVGGVTETVEVTAMAPLLQTDSTEIGTHIDSVATENIPLITRNYGQLTLLTPGAVSTNPGSFTSGQSTFQVGRPYINGNREQTDNYILDGIDNNQNDNNDVAYSPNVDAIQEFNLISQNPSAEFGNFLGGIVNATMKSGTNSYHGSLFEFLRNDDLNANEWSSNLAGKNAAGHEIIPRSRLRYNQFGGTFGGPILKDKLFFFVDYQGQRMPNHSTQSVTVLSAAERAGNFSELLASGIQLFKPQSGVAPTARGAIAGNNLTAAGLTLSPAALAIVKSSLYPLPNAANNKFVYQQTTQTNENQGDIKIDWVLSQKDHFFGRYTQQDVENPTTETYLLASNGITNFSYPLKNLVLDWTRAISPSLLNDLRFGVNYFPINQGYTNPTGQNLPQTFG